MLAYVIDFGIRKDQPDLVVLAGVWMIPNDRPTSDVHRHLVNLLHNSDKRGGGKEEEGWGREFWSSLTMDIDSTEEETYRQHTEGGPSQGHTCCQGPNLRVEAGPR